jgi:hypothetical protein
MVHRLYLLRTIPFFIFFFFLNLVHICYCILLPMLRSSMPIFTSLLSNLFLNQSNIGATSGMCLYHVHDSS